MTKVVVPISANLPSSRVGDMVELGAAGKAFAIVELLVQRDYPVQTSEIVHITGISKPSAHRLLNFLVEWGYVQRHPVLTGYVIGKNLALMAHQVLTNQSGSGSQRIHLERLVAKVKETVNVGALFGDHVIYYERVEAAWPLGLHFQAGSKVPMHCTSIGKLMLALKPQKDARALLADSYLQRYTPNTITNIPQLMQDLERIKVQDFSIDNQEFMNGVCCVAVPVRASEGQVVACMAISAPEARLTLADLEGFLPDLRRAADGYVVDLESQKNESMRLKSVKKNYRID
jgi:DNA-binding IclR family transcriptional regulator